MSIAPAAGLGASHATAVAARVPPSFFSMVLGLAALSAAWRGASRAFAVSPWLADGLLVASAVLWVVLAGAQVVKAVTAPGKLREELADPIEGNLAALAPASLLALAAGASPRYRELAEVLFWLGAGWQLVHAVWAVGSWRARPLDARRVTPALYLPAAVGSLLAAAAAGAVGRTELGWLFFGAGVASWLVLAAVLLARHVSGGELPAAARPLAGLELAPPAFALVAWQALAGATPDPAARALLGVTLFVALVLLRLAGRLRDVPFGATWWALAFPVAALSAATFRAAAPGSLAADLALPLFVAANAAVAAIAYRTVVALGRGALLPPD